jgi:RHH-type rel operon transcriptional repressor/antitoxin RelB
MLAGGKVLPPYDSLWAGHRDATDDAHAAPQQVDETGRLVYCQVALRMAMCWNTLNTQDYMHSKGYIMATSIRLDPAIEQRLDKLAAQTGRTKAYYLRELVAKGLDDLEDYYLAAATMERVRKGEERIYSLEEAERDLGLAD